MQDVAVLDDVLLAFSAEEAALFCFGFAAGGQEVFISASLGIATYPCDGEDAETLETGLNAALRGGYTAVCCMPNTRPPLDNAAIASSIAARARALGLADLYVVGCVTRAREGRELAEMAEELGRNQADLNRAQAVALGIPVYDEMSNAAAASDPMLLPPTSSPRLLLRNRTCLAALIVPRTAPLQAPGRTREHRPPRRLSADRLPE